MGTYVTGDGDRLWHNPDVPSPSAVIDHDGKIDFSCPNPDCQNNNPGDTAMRLRLDDDDDVAEFLELIDEDHDGTTRCDACDEPLYGVFGDGDHDDDFAVGGWKAATPQPKPKPQSKP